MTRAERIATLLWHFRRCHHPVISFVPVTKEMREQVMEAQKRSGLDQLAWAYAGGLPSAFVTKLKYGVYRTISVTSLAKVKALLEATDRAFPKGLA